MIMQDNEKKPALRFKGFTDPWEQRKLGELSRSFEYGLNAAAKEYDGQNKYLRITDIDDTSRQFVSADITSPDANLAEADNYRLSDGDVLFARTGASVGKTYLYKKSDGLVYFAGFLIRAKIKESVSAGFIFQNTLTRSYERYIAITSQRSGQPGVNAQEYAEYQLMLPELFEQEKIAKLLEALDTLITLHQRKYEKLVNIKKSMLDKMFPQNGASVPEIRFKGFTDPWEQRKFGEVVDKYEDPVETPHDGYYRLGIRSHAKGTFHSYVEKGHELETAQMYRVAAGNFIVNITFGWEHAVAITNESDAGKLVSHRFPQYSFHDDMLPEFFKYVIADEDFRHWLWLASPGGAGRNRVLKLDEMLNYEMVLPSKEEQQRIAAIFRNLDTLITLHQRKLEKLQNIKKSCLEKMFV